VPEWWEAFKAFIGRTEEGLQGQIGSAGTQIYDAFEEVRKQAKASINKLVPEPVASAAGRAGDRLAKVVESEQVKLGIEFATPLGPVVGSVSRFGVPSRLTVAKKFQQGPVRVQADTEIMSEKVADAVAAARKHADKAFGAMDEVQYARFVDMEGLGAAKDMRRAAALQSEADEAETMIKNFENFLEADSRRIAELGRDLEQIETIERIHQTPELMQEFIDEARHYAMDRSLTLGRPWEAGKIDEVVKSGDVAQALESFAKTFTAEDIEDLLKSIGPLIR
jgi:hypothetical protein